MRLNDEGFMLKDLILKSVTTKDLDFAFCIKSLSTGEEALYNENVVIPSASLIKVPIMAEILSQVKNRKLSLNQRIVVKDEDKVPYSILSLLQTGNSYTLKDIITLMIIQSDNTATNLLIHIAGIENINNLLKSINVRSTVLQRKMMDFEARRQGMDNYTTAADIARIIELIFKGVLVDQEYSNMMINIMKEQLYNDMVHMYIPDDIVVAHKTGSLHGIDHDAGIVYLDNCNYIFSILTWNAHNNSTSRRVVSEIHKIIYEYFTDKLIELNC